MGRWPASVPFSSPSVAVAALGWSWLVEGAARTGVCDEGLRLCRVEVCRAGGGVDRVMGCVGFGAATPAPAGNGVAKECAGFSAATPAPAGNGVAKECAGFGAATPAPAGNGVAKECVIAESQGLAQDEGSDGVVVADSDGAVVGGAATVTRRDEPSAGRRPGTQRDRTNPRRGRAARDARQDDDETRHGRETQPKRGHRGAIRASRRRRASPLVGHGAPAIAGPARRFARPTTPLPTALSAIGLDREVLCEEPLDCGERSAHVGDRHLHALGDLGGSDKLAGGPGLETDLSDRPEPLVS